MLLRNANAADALDLAKLMNIAGSGMPAARWKQLDPNVDFWETGKSAVQDTEGEFSHRNCRVLQSDTGEICAMINSFLMSSKNLEETVPWPEFAVPIQKLEGQCLNSYYINFLATFDQFQNRGFAAQLLRDVENHAKSLSVGKLNLIVNSRKKEVRKYYERLGFTVIAQEQAIPMGEAFEGDDWLLMRKNLATI